MIVYLGGAIDLAGPKGQDWKTKVKEELKNKGITCIDPAGAFSYARSNNKEDRVGTAQTIIAINKFSLENSNMAIIVINKNVPSVGTPIELKLCADELIPHVVVWDGHHQELPVYVEGLANKIVYTLEDAIKWAIEYKYSEINNNPDYGVGVDSE